MNSFQATIFDLLSAILATSHSSLVIVSVDTLPRVLCLSPIISTKILQMGDLEGVL